MKKKAFVLSGGGVLSAYQVGVLSKLDIPPDSPEHITKLYGVSGGALASIAYSYLGKDGSIKLFKDIKHRKDIFGYNITNLFRKDAVYTHKPLKKLIDRVVSNFKPMHEVSVGAVSLEYGFLRHFSNQGLTKEFVDMATASACIPGLVQPRKNYVDGAVIDNTPLKAAIKDGFTDITVILTENPTAAPPIMDTDNISVIDILLRSYELMRLDAFREDLRVCLLKNNELHYRDITLTIYALDQGRYSALDFNSEAIEALISEGIKARPL